MEELRSTEALDREILEDARKKALKILRAADSNAESQAKKWDEQTQKAVEEIRQSYVHNTEKAKQEILARFPLDKRRLRSEISETFLREAMNNYLDGLNRNNLLLILEWELEKRLIACGETDLGLPKNESAQTDSGVRIKYQRLDNYEVNDLLKKVFSMPEIKKKFKLANFQTQQDAKSSALFPVIIFDTPAIRITASVENAAAEILMSKRAELAAALLGKEVLND